MSNLEISVIVVSAIGTFMFLRMLLARRRRDEEPATKERLAIRRWCGCHQDIGPALIAGRYFANHPERVFTSDGGAIVRRDICLVNNKYRDTVLERIEVTE